MELIDFMSEKLVILLKATNKTEAVIELATLAGEQGLVDDVEDLTEKLFYREQLMSTGLGMGIGIPHVRYNELKKPGVLLGIQAKGIPDYESIDNIPVKIVVMILLRDGEQKVHLRLLSQIVKLLKDPQVIEDLIKAGDSKTAFDIIRNIS